MKCPKCDFDQPEDRFCANCGVDVALYVPQRKSLKSYFSPTFFYLVLATFVVVLLIRYVQSQRAPIDEKLLTADRSTSVFKKTRPMAENQEQDAPAMAESPTEPETNLPPPTPPPAPPTLKPKATTFRISFYEVDASFVATLIGSNVGNVLSIGNVVDETNSKFADRMNTGTGNGAVIKLDSSVQTISNDDQNPNTFSFVSLDSRINGEIGLMFHLKAGLFSETGSSVSIEGRRIIGREDIPQADVLNFQRDVVIPLQAPAYVVGLVRGRNPIDAQELNALSENPVLRIFRSERFRANQSLLVVLIEAVERP